MSRFCNNNVRPRTNPGEKRWRWYEEAVSRRWQWNYERRGGMNVFLWKLLFFFSLFLFFPFFRTSNQRQITIVHSAAWGSFVNREKAGGGVRCMQHSSTETVKFPLLVLTRGALSRCKSIPPPRRNTKFTRSNRGMSKNDENFDGDFEICIWEDPNTERIEILFERILES